MAAFVPTPAAEHADPIVEGLLEIDAEAVLHRGPERMRGNFGDWSEASEKIIDRLPVVAHVGVIHEAEQAQYAFLAAEVRRAAPPRCFRRVRG